MPEWSAEFEIKAGYAKGHIDCKHKSGRCIRRFMTEARGENLIRFIHNQIRLLQGEVNA